MFKIFFTLTCLLVYTFSAFSQSPVFIGIAGGTGSGKTTLAEKIHKELPNSILISQDSYYKDLSHLSSEEQKNVNFDHPNSLDFSLLKQHLINLKNGQSIEQPVYNFNISIREKQTITINQ